MSKILTIEETSHLIQEGKRLLICGLESSIGRLPKGHWIAGTSSHFIGPEGGVSAKDRLSVEVLEFPTDQISIRTYGPDEVLRVTNDAFENGYSIIILPFQSDVHLRYALDVPNNVDLFMHPVVGFVAGVEPDPNDPESYKNTVPKVFNGETGLSMTEQAVVMHVSLLPHWMASVGIINFYDLDPSSPAIQFEETSYHIKDAIIDGVKRPLAPYLREHQESLLIEDCLGAQLNVETQEIKEDDELVHFYRPVIAGPTYRFMRHDVDSDERIAKLIEPWKDKDVAMSFLCSSNYAYFHLEGKKLGPFMGGCGFGEVAYRLLNATLVYLTIQEV